MSALGRLPLVAQDVECLVRHRLAAPELRVAVGQLVEPETILAMAADGLPRSARIALAAELGVAPADAARYLVRALGERVEAGEVVAVRRRGLRSQEVTSPIAGRLATLDAETGLLTVVTDPPRRAVPALVAGEVRSVADDAVTIRAIGDLLLGASLLGREGAGPLIVLADRPDRELPAEEFDERCRGAIVLAGMTVSSAALRRLHDVGAAGVIVGGLSTHALEPFWGSATPTRLQRALVDPSADWPFPFGVLMLEGFGRLPVPEPAFDFLAERAGRWVALLSSASLGLDRPACFVSSRSLQGQPLQPVALVPGAVVHLRLPARPGLGRLVSVPFVARQPDSLAFRAVWVERDGNREIVPVDLVDPVAADA
ncbi:MAG: hypothetical protein J7449_01045 [Thermomicrobium sp.]|uniref:hypothetical protein n=1 Tax=Thermomicrobium sp. TaxID=1969469 RepID=UPI001B0C1C4A|nr:hypothetical protein [Thermomicrobium sp.]MBO9350048.1 hypothetical protein [Thermomicrobium sp.]